MSIVIASGSVPAFSSFLNSSIAEWYSNASATTSCPASSKCFRIIMRMNAASSTIITFIPVPSVERVILMLSSKQKTIPS
jgi:hypothetical protein